MAIVRGTIQVEGTARLRKQLERLDGTMRKKTLERMVEAGGELVREVAAQKAPVRTGQLAASQIVQRIKSSAYRAEAGIGPDEDAWYGVFAEFGTVHHAAQPFLRPAYDEQKQNAVNAMANEGRQAIKRAVR